VSEARPCVDSYTCLEDLTKNEECLEHMIIVIFARWKDLARYGDGMETTP
jgi:hypothetical protein